MKQPVTYDNRELSEIQHALYYAENLAHGTVGHNMLMLIAKLAKEQGFYMEGGELMFFDKEDGVYRNAFQHFKMMEELP